MNRVITFTTDFGLQDGYVGTMKGVALSINPQAILVDITHAIAPQNIQLGALLFAASFQYFPPDAVHVVVVDPGVGGTRRAIAAQVGETQFVAPDNGVLTLALEQMTAARPDVDTRVVHMNRSEYWLPQVSRTFHGRDIFAPVAAHLSLGVPLDALGDPIDDWVHLALAQPERRPDGTISARVIHIDRFGNVVINLAEVQLRKADWSKLVITIGGETIKGLENSYGDVQTGHLVALIGSAGFLEVALRDGNAAQVLGAQIGQEVLLTP
ncbi:MAG: SAM-dependent chlorinase/fluorinase [Chloroflexi bacterium]|nr:SAM-dependent chlorinase/fluorinase [Chloroflexota bacterium]